MFIKGTKSTFWPPLPPPTIFLYFCHPKMHIHAKFSQNRTTLQVCPRIGKICKNQLKMAKRARLTTFYPNFVLLFFISQNLPTYRIGGNRSIFQFSLKMGVDANKILYNAIVKLHIEYGITFCGNACDKVIKLVKIEQR